MTCNGAFRPSHEISAVLYSIIPIFHYSMAPLLHAVQSTHDYVITDGIFPLEQRSNGCCIAATPETEESGHKSQSTWHLCTGRLQGLYRVCAVWTSR